MTARPCFPPLRRRLHQVPRRCVLACAAAIVIGIAGPARAAPADAGNAPPAGVTAEALAPFSAPRGATLFTTMDPEQTGVRVENAYADPAMWWEHYSEFSLGAIGTGVAMADYDGDGRCDLYVVSKVEPNHLFRNLGGWRFEDVTAQAGVAGPAGAWKQGACFADVNNDGWLDLYVCRFAAPNLLFLNQGDGTFREGAQEAGLAVVDASGVAAFADYDRDGWLDLYLQTNVLAAESHPKGQRDHLFHNDGDGTFTEVTDAAGIHDETQGHSATWWDYDADGWPDLYAANDFKDPDQLYRNNGDGTFNNVLSLVVPHIPQSSMGADLGDVNNDGLMDLFVADMAATSHYKDHRGMAKLRAGTLENEENPVAAPQYMRNALFLNTGTGFCREAAFLAGVQATDWTWSVRFEDLDNDGWLDLHVTNGMVRELHNTDLVDRMLRSESMRERVRLMKASPVLAEANLAFRNTGDLRFENVSHEWGLDQVGVSFGTAFGDLDGDGDLDLAFTNYQGNVTLCRNDSDSGHRLIVALRGTTTNRFGVGAVVRATTAQGTQIRQLVIARGYQSSSEPVLHFGLGAAETVDRLAIEWPSGRTQELTGLAADRRYTIVEPESAPAAGQAASAPPRAKAAHPPATAVQFNEVGARSNLSLLAREGPTGELEAQPLLPFRLNRFGPGVAVGDLDGDRLDDLCLGGPSGQSAQLLLAIGGGQFLAFGARLFSDDVAAADAAPLIFDADADGDNDLLVPKGGVAQPAGSSAYRPRLFLNDGSAHFQAAPKGTLPDFAGSVGPAVAADFDRDGRLDVFFGGRFVPGAWPSAPTSALWVNRGGKFEDVTVALAPELARIGMVTGALWSDVDQDDWPDLLVALEWGGVHYFHNVEGRRFEDWSETAGVAEAGSGWWHSLAAADFNGDGRLDYAAGNVGLNTRYRASPKHPALLLVGAFGADDQPRLVEVETEGDRLYPMRGRGELGAALPWVLKRFPTYESYAGATIEDLLPADRLAAARRYEATEFRSGVFLSQPDGHYRFQPLPRIAQIAPAYGLAAGDFDGDGRADLYLVQNDYSPIAEVSRFDGGLSQLLRGDGRGGFAPAPLRETGLIVPNDGKAVGVFDRNQDGWPDFFITRNNDRTLVYENSGRPGRHSFGVALRGRGGNPTAVGARITVVLADGSTQTSEVNAGSGYLSQSSPVRFFGYPDAQPPREIRVHWPSGQNTVEAWTAPAARVVVLTTPAP